MRGDAAAPTRPLKLRLPRDLVKAASAASRNRTTAPRSSCSPASAARTIGSLGGPRARLALGRPRPLGREAQRAAGVEHDVGAERDVAVAVPADRLVQQRRAAWRAGSARTAPRPAGRAARRRARAGSSGRSRTRSPRSRRAASSTRKPIAAPVLRLSSKPGSPPPDARGGERVDDELEPARGARQRLVAERARRSPASPRARAGRRRPR